MNDTWIERANKGGHTLLAATDNLVFVILIAPAPKLASFTRDHVEALYDLSEGTAIFEHVRELADPRGPVYVGAQEYSSAHDAALRLSSELRQRIHWASGFKPWQDGDQSVIVSKIVHGFDELDRDGIRNDFGFIDFPSLHARIDVDTQRVLAAIGGRAGAAHVEEPPSAVAVEGSWYRAAWYQKASGHQLSPERLRTAANRRMIKRRKMSRSRRGHNEYELSDVCTYAGEHIAPRLIEAHRRSKRDEAQPSAHSYKKAIA